MSTRTWDSGIGGAVAGLLYMLMFIFAILIGIVQSRQWNVAAIPGIILCVGCLYTWCWGLFRRINKKKV